MSAAEDEQPGVLDAIRWHTTDEGEGIDLEVVHDPEKERTVFFDPEIVDGWIEADDDWVVEVPQ